MFSVSKNSPSHEAPSPKKHRTTVRCRGAAGERRPARHREVAGDDRVRRDQPHRVGEVHRPALSLADPGGTSHQLRHHPDRIDPLQNRLAVAAVGREDQVVLVERRHRARLDPLLADARMGRAGDEALPEGIDDLVLEGANLPHRPVQAEQLVVAEVVGAVARARLVDRDRHDRHGCCSPSAAICSPSAASSRPPGFAVGGAVVDRDVRPHAGPHGDPARLRDRSLGDATGRNSSHLRPRDGPARRSRQAGCQSFESCWSVRRVMRAGGRLRR